MIVNNDPYMIEFGGLPKNFNLYGHKHFLRFTALPDNLEPGKINIPGMVRTHLSRDLRTPPLLEYHLEELPSNDLDIGMLVDNAIEANRDGLPNMLANSIPQMPNLSVMPPIANLPQFAQKLDNQNIPGFGNDVQMTSVPPPLANMNINDLFQKLVATGILGKNDEKEKDDKVNKKKELVVEKRHKISPISFSKMETIKM